MNKIQQSNEQKYASDLQQARAKNPYVIKNPDPYNNPQAIDIATTPVSPYRREKIKPATETDEKYLDNFNQTRADEARTQVLPAPKKREVPFPWIGLLICLINDILDILQLFGVTIPATEIIDFLMFIIRGLGKIIVPNKTGWGGLIGTWIIEAIPWIGMLPCWTAYLIWNWWSERKIANQEYKQAIDNVKMQAVNQITEEL